MTETTAASTDELPLAITLDEATLRQVFPEAPAELAVPRDVGSMFSARMKSLGGARRATWMLGGGALVAVGLVLLAAGMSTLGAIVAAAPLVALAVVAFLQHGKATDDFFDRYAAARGLTHVEGGRVPADVPLFRKGDKRKWSRVLGGTVAGQPASISHYTYTDVTRDSDGNREETDYDFTCVHFTLPPQVAARYPGVYCRPRAFLSLGGIADGLTHDRKVELESIDFAKRYSLRVVDEQDDIALYELFTTAFVERLATELHVFWEQCGADLVVWKKGHEREAADLDRMCLEAWHVLHRYLEEWR